MEVIIIVCIISKVRKIWMRMNTKSCVARMWDGGEGKWRMRSTLNKVRRAFNHESNDENPAIEASTVCSVL